MFSKGLVLMDTPVLTDRQRYIPQLCADRFEDLTKVMAYRDGCRERVKEIKYVVTP